MKTARRLLIIALLLFAPGAALAAGVQLFTGESEAQQHCPADIVVWVNTPTGIYHFKGMRWYGNTTSGAFACKKEVDRAGFRLSVFCRYCSGHGD